MRQQAGSKAIGWAGGGWKRSLEPALTEKGVERLCRGRFGVNEDTSENLSIVSRVAMNEGRCPYSNCAPIVHFIERMHSLQLLMKTLLLPTRAFVPRSMELLIQYLRLYVEVQGCMSMRDLHTS